MNENEQIHNSVLNIKNLDKTIENIAFFSDLHFDHTNKKYKPTNAQEHESDFVKILLENHNESLVLLAGDFYDDYRKTMSFIDRLEREHIYGFFVLGNHDYWNKGKFTYDEMIKLYQSHTEYNLYFKMLLSGVSYQISDIIFIGDTGWTSFDKGKGVINLNTKIIELPEENQIKDFSYKKVLEYHTKWIDYANSILDKNNKVIVLTHFPMFSCAVRKNADLWWSSKTNIREKDNCWKIHGHTHKNYQNHNRISYQRGYEHMSDRSFFRYNDMPSYVYFSRHIGKLVKLSDSKNLVDPGGYIMNQHYKNQLLLPENQTEIINVKKRGFARSAANRGVFVALSSNSEDFINKVEKRLKGYLDNVFINYTPYKGLTHEEIATIENAIIILKKNNVLNVRVYMTASVIAGYVWNGMPQLVSSMRPLDDYDIVRFYLMFLTIKKYRLSISDVKKVRKNPNFSVKIGNVDIFIPMVNNYTLEPEEAQIELSKTKLLGD